MLQAWKLLFRYDMYPNRSGHFSRWNWVLKKKKKRKKNYDVNS